MPPAARSLPPPAEALRLSDAEERRCADYGRARLALDLAQIAVLPATAAALTLTGAARAILEFTALPGIPAWVAHGLFLLMVGVITRLAVLPVQWLNEHWLERRFGLSHQSGAAWLWEWLCRSAVFGTAVLACLLPVVETLRWWPWLVLPWCAGFLLLRPLFMRRFHEPLLRRFYPVRFLREETFALPGVGRRTLPVYEVRVGHATRRVNAALCLTSGEPAIVVTDTLIGAFTDGEERVVMAHEFGHLYDRLHLEERTPAGVAQAQRKVAWGLAQLLAAAGALALLHLLAPALGLAGAHDLAGFPLLAALAIVLAHCLTPALNREARQDERDADAYALAATDDPENYLSVMRKLRAINLEEAAPHPLRSLFFGTHPSYLERAGLALDYRRRRSPRRARPWRGWRHIQRHGRR